jgi:hypothetical protein
VRQPHPQPGPHQEDEQHLAGRSARSTQALGLLRLAGHARPTIWSRWQPASQRQRRPGAQPVMDLLIGQAPQCPQQGHQQQGSLAIDPRRSTRTRGQRRGTLLLSELHRHATHLQEVQAGDQRQRVQMQRRGHCPVIRWRGNGRLVHVQGTCHGMPPGRGSKPRTGASYLTSLGWEARCLCQTWKRMKMRPGGRHTGGWSRRDEIVA